MKKFVLAQELSDHLNDLLELDKNAVSELFETRVECNKELSDFRFVTVLPEDGKLLLGLLGVINGFIRAREGEDAPIVAAIFQDSDMTTVGVFRTIDPLKTWIPGMKNVPSEPS